MSFVCAYSGVWEDFDATRNKANEDTVVVVAERLYSYLRTASFKLGEEVLSVRVTR